MKRNGNKRRERRLIANTDPEFQYNDSQLIEGIAHILVISLLLPNFYFILGGVYLAERDSLRS